ncbi:MAG: lysophospholipid acyltransferase family protein [Flavobacteriales bacterium]|nr:lysophospholipid acyltransferase family protein [Flavobacteriales bacterium]
MFVQAITYYISLPFIYLISILPFWLLYRFSDFLYFIIYFVFSYRKKVVLQNLRNSFPEKSEEEIAQIAKKFYTFFCDWIVETIKSLTISKEAAIKRCHFTNTDILDKYHKENKKLIFVMGHMGSFELAGAEMAFNTKYNLYVIFKPLSNKYFDNLIKSKRTRFDSKVIAMNDTFRTMIHLKENKELSATLFIADQTPQPNSAYWTTFLNQETAIFWGTEIIAKKLNYPVIYISMRQPKRGYYEITPELLCENPASTQKGEISEMHTKRLAQDIKKQPEIWLWSHKRWKHKKP